MTALRRTLVATASLAALVSTGLVATAPLAHAVSATAPVVITEVYGGGGNSGATYRNDFIELTNTSASPVDLTGWSVQYAASTGTTWSTTPLSGQILPGQYYLVAEAAGTGGTTDLPTPDVVGTIPLSGGNGKVALVSSAAALSGCAAGCSTAAGVVDFVGYGSADDSAGGHPAPGLSNPTSAQRDVSASNTADNAADFAGEAPTPKAPGVRPTGGTPNPCDTTPLPPECTPGPTSIQDIQGPGFVSPLKGQLVSRVPGVVTAKRANGYWMQQVAPDATLTSTSSGVFVFTSSAPSVSVGDSVLVSATVSDFYQLAFGETVATTASLSVTELTTVTALATLSKGNPLPAPLALTPTTVPTLYAPTVAGGNVESISPVDASHSALEFWEAHEGMLVSVNDARVVGPGKPQFGEIYVTTKPDELSTPRGGTYLPSYAGTPSGRLLVSPTSGGVPAANVGDILTGATTGPVDWSAFGGYDIAATTLGTWTDNHLQPTSAVPQADDQLAIATYNVENLAPADPQSKYDALGAGVVTHLASPDVIAVEEIQDNSGATDDGVVAADATIAKLTAAISAAGGPAYSSASIDPVNDADGGQPGGNIR
ncbi:MAG: lamin tail domain-containing protein, partial [Lapillicoccus sp.]